MGQKGGSYERELCKEFSKWWTGGKRDDVFWRSSGSGARAKVRGRRGAATFGSHGDMVAVDPIGSPLIDLITWEFKRGYSAQPLLELVDRPSHVLPRKWEQWLQQATESSQQAGSFSWVIVHRRDKSLATVTMPSDLWGLLMPPKIIPRLRMNVTYRTSDRVKRHGKWTQQITGLKEAELVSTTLERMLQFVPPSLIRSLSNEV